MDDQMNDGPDGVNGSSFPSDPFAEMADKSATLREVVSGGEPQPSELKRLSRKYEYRFVRKHSLLPGDLERQANELGAQGFKLVTTVAYISEFLVFEKYDLVIEDK